MTSPPRSKRRRRRTKVERPPPPPQVSVPRGFGLSFWTALLAGAWLGRASVALPGGLDEAFDLLLPMAAAVFVFLSYRRWIRARLAASTAARGRAGRRNGPSA